MTYTSSHIKTALFVCLSVCIQSRQNQSAENHICCESAVTQIK